jgi:hypothetical protein
MVHPRSKFDPPAVGKPASRLIFNNESLKGTINSSIRKDLPPVQGVTRVMHSAILSKLPCRIGWLSISSDQKWHMDEPEILRGGLP